MGFAKVLQGFSRLIDAILTVSDGLKDLVDVIREVGPAANRLEALELSRHQFEAECAGALLKAEGKLKAANNSEARERQLKKSYERESDSVVADGEETTEDGELVLPLHVAPGETKGVPAVRVGVAPIGKAAALISKWSA